MIDPGEFRRSPSRSQQRVIDPRFFAHSQRCQCAGIARVRLAPLQPALGKVFSPQRIDHRHRVATPVEVARQRPEIVSTRLKYHSVDRTLLLELALQLIETSTVGGEPKHASLGFPFARPTDRGRVLVRTHINADHSVHGALLMLVDPRGSRLPLTSVH